MTGAAVCAGMYLHVSLALSLTWHAPLPARHLALVQPEATLGSYSVRVAAVAADFAASALAQRFAAVGSGGIDELVAAAAAGGFFEI